MAQKIKDSNQIYKLAVDLGITVQGDLVEAILQYCDVRVNSFMVDSDCETLSEMLDWIAARLGTSFRTIQTDKDLLEIKKEYIGKKETGFVQIESELNDEVFGITFRLQHRKEWEPEYVSLIDSRRDKAARAYFTKWHEIAHLLTQSSRMQGSFKRTHPSVTQNDPEERLMDIIAGRFGFYGPIVRKFLPSELSFENIELIRQQLCPEASKQSALINIIRFWPRPCILIGAAPGLRKDQIAQQSQQSFFFHEPPIPVLRAVQTNANNAAREKGFTIHNNMRIPETSIIFHVFSGKRSYDKTEENLSWWESSNGKHLPDWPIRVEARRSLDSVDALIIPAD